MSPLHTKLYFKQTVNWILSRFVFILFFLALNRTRTRDECSGERRKFGNFFFLRFTNSLLLVGQIKICFAKLKPASNYKYIFNELKTKTKHIFISAHRMRQMDIQHSKIYTSGNADAGTCWTWFNCFAIGDVFKKIKMHM